MIDPTGPWCWLDWTYDERPEERAAREREEAERHVKVYGCCALVAFVVPIVLFLAAFGLVKLLGL